MIKKTLLSFSIFFLTLYCMFYLYGKFSTNEAIEGWRVTGDTIDHGLPERDKEHPERPFLHFEIGWPALAKVHTVSFLGEEKVWDVVYEIDKDHLRINPPPTNATNRTIVLGGCSFTFGEGLSGEETLSYFLQSQYKDTRVINMGISGGGTQVLHRYFDRKDIKSVFGLDETTFVYVFIHEHLARWHARPLYFTWVTPNRPHYTISNGRAEYQGPISETSGYIAYQKAKALELSKTWNMVSNVVASEYIWTDKELDDFSLSILDLKKKFNASYPSDKFFFVYHPFGDIQPDIRDRLTKNLNHYEISVLNNSDQASTFLHKQPQDIPYFFPDGHPRPAFNKFFSIWLAQSLKE
jgi:hypothetical protein